MRVHISTKNSLYLVKLIITLSILSSGVSHAEEAVSVSTKSLTGLMAMKLAMATYNACTKR